MVCDFMRGPMVSLAGFVFKYIVENTHGISHISQGVDPFWAVRFIWNTAS
jgi:hypothetical protein